MDKIVNCSVNGKCSCCGGCCTDYVPWNKEEIIRVAEYLKKHPEIEEQNKNLSQDSFNVFCSFNDEKTHKCLIYPVRPSICRTFMCSMNDQAIVENKKKHFKNAYVNGHGKFCSTHSLFFKHFDWDKKFLCVESKTLADKNGLDPIYVYNSLCGMFELQYVIDDEEEK